MLLNQKYLVTSFIKNIHNSNFLVKEDTENYIQTKSSNKNIFNVLSSFSLVYCLQKVIVVLAAQL